jgi:hypothetical protein
LGVPLLFTEEFEVVIMIGRLPIEEMHGSDRVPDLSGLRASLVGWKRQPINESEMALFSECSLQCARKVLDTADIVREAMYRQLRNQSRMQNAKPPFRQSFLAASMFSRASAASFAASDLLAALDALPQARQGVSSSLGHNFDGW